MGIGPGLVHWLGICKTETLKGSCVKLMRAQNLNAPQNGTALKEAIKGLGSCLTG
jgi:hypothetical protein